MNEGLDPRLEARLARVADPLARGDWAEVRCRAGLVAAKNRRRRRRLVLALAVIVLAALTVIPAFGLGSRLLDLLSVEQSQEVAPIPGTPAGVPPLPYVYGDVLVGPGGEAQWLARPLLAPLLGYDMPVAFPSPDGRYVLYHAWARGVPSLRLKDTASGRDIVLEHGAQSAAWRADGALAYARALTPRYTGRQPYVGHVVVRPAWKAPAERWTEQAGVYTVIGWAGERLIVTSSSTALLWPDPLPEPGVLALDGPGSARALGLSDAVAISPDGTLVLGGFRDPPGADSPSPFVRVVRVADGEVVSRLDLRRAADESVPREWLGGGLRTTGFWVGERILAVSTLGSVSSLVILRFRDGGLAVERVLRLDDKAKLRGPYGAFFSAPIALDEEARRIVVRVDVPAAGERPPLIVFLTCDRVQGSCVRGAPIRTKRAISVVYDVSRPLAGQGGR